MDPPASVPVHHNSEARRFEMTIEGRLSVAEYRLEGNDMVFTHTGVPRELEGRSIASRLVQAAVEYARRENKHIVPRCSYVAAWLKRHPDF
jgi:predicted GNAT family acetyltransferase